MIQGSWRCLTLRHYVAYWPWEPVIDAAVMWSVRITLAELRYSFQAPFCNKPASSTTNRLLNKWLQGCTPPETSFPPTTSFRRWNLIQKYSPADRVGPEFPRNSHVVHNITRVWSRLVSTPWVPGTSRAPCFGFPECATPPSPHWGWGHNHRNYSLCECLSPRINSKNRRAPSSCPLRVSRHGPTVPNYPSKEASNRYLQLYLTFCGKTEDLKCYEGEKKRCL